MPRFRVYLEQWVEEIATVIVEADNEQEARDKVNQMLADGEVDMWEDGSDIRDTEIVKVAKLKAV